MLFSGAVFHHATADPAYANLGTECQPDLMEQVLSEFGGGRSAFGKSLHSVNVRRMPC